jgi:ribosome-binding factor A
MSRRKSSRRQLESLCADVHPDDGLDAKEFFSQRVSSTQEQKRAFPRKTLQLCSQVADTLNLVLSGDCADECLQCLQVVAVTPAPNASQLLVVVCPSSAGAAPDPVTVFERLAGANGRLRSEVAAAIVRRRVPRLIFQYVGCDPGGATEA